MDAVDIFNKIKILQYTSYGTDNQMPNVVILGKNVYDKLNSYNQAMISNYETADTCMGMDIVVDYKNLDVVKVGYVFE